MRKTRRVRRGAGAALLTAAVLAGALRARAEGPETGAGAVASGAAWAHYCERLARAGARILREDAPGAPADRAEAMRYLARLVRSGIDRHLERWDPSHPVLRWSSSTWGLPNADAKFATVPLRGDAVYRLSGRRGSVRWLNFQVTAGWFDDPSGMRVVDEVSGDELTLGPEGSFELFLSAEQHPGDALRLAPDASMLTVRQFFYDWDRERPAEVRIERVGGPLAPPAPEPERTARQLDAAARFVEHTAGHFADMAVAHRARGTNVFHAPRRADDQLGIRRNIYVGGYFELEPDQALVLEVAPPACHYWGLQLGSFWLEPIDYAHHQSSLNGHQAALDADGVFRAVIAHRDPGVANWLDTAGHREGLMQFRWLQCDGAPVPRTRVVALADVGAALPEGTPRVDPAARRAVLERRRAGVDRRYR